MSDLDRDHWNARYLDRSGAIKVQQPEPFLVEVASILPTEGRALDIAGGDGRNGIWLAGRGLDVTVADVSTEALRLAESQARASRVSITTLAIDLDCDPIPPGPWNLVVCVLYLNRPLLAAIADHLGPDGLLLVVHPTVRNLERFDRPGARYLLGDGELPKLLDGWTILRSEESWRTDSSGRHDARCLARKPAILARP